MKDRGREKGISASIFPLDDNSFDTVYQIHPDIIRWTLSVQDVKPSGSDIFSGSLDNFPEGTHYFEDQLPIKDDDSVISSMDDSTYMSQSDSSRCAAPAKEHFKQIPEETMPQAYENFLYSPALSSEQHHVIHETPSEMNRLFVPSSLEEADAGNMSLAVPDFTNYTTSSYGRYAEYGMPRQALSAISQTNNLIPGNGWPSLPSHNYENSYSMGPDDNSFYSQSIQVQQESRNQRPHSLRSSAGEDTTSQFSQHRLAQQSVRPRLQRNDGSMNSKRSDDTMVSNTSPSHENVIGDVSARLSFVDQQANNYGTSLLPSPTSCTASIGAVNASVVSEYRKSNLSTDVVPGSSSATQIPQDYFSQLDSMSNQNSTEDAEGKKARTHSLYQASPGEDELYHCPHEGQLGCSHKPTKLKCNYDKYVDSHLRPFRCKSNMCSGVQFSSTACLLRHEREAHGMHGHGNKPHLCTFEGCERSLPDHGFPRRYNLLDHMKRVHDYTGPPSPSEKELALQEISGKRQVGRKRKASSEIIQPSDKKIKITAAPERPLPPPKPKRKRLEITNLRDEWTQRRLLLVQFLQDLRVEDVGQHQFIADKIEELKRLSENFALFDGQG